MPRFPRAGCLPKRDEHDVADALLAKAVGDEAGLRALVDNHDVPDHVAGFLAQQAIEKAIKAVLIARDVPFERKHDIDYLCSLIEDAGLDLTPDLSAAVTLTPWAVEFRYADPFDAPPLDRTKALETVVAVREWAAQMIGVEAAVESGSDSSSDAETPTANR
jgi:HEPN domain-containing protein